MITCPRCRRGNAYPLRENPDRYECIACGLVWGGRDPDAKVPPPPAPDPAAAPRGIALGLVLSAIIVAVAVLAWYAWEVVA